MSATSSIEWTEATWNPVTGCTKVSPGCDHCYAETFAERFRGVPGHHFERGFDVQLRPEKLDLPLRWRKPKRIFVNSMSDLFHKDVPDEYIADVFAVMALARRHTFQLLTKRPARMRSLLSDDRFAAAVRSARSNRVEVDDRFSDAARFRHDITWPLPNVWVGVSVEDQKWADIRIPALRETPAAVRWISAEPLLGPVDLTRYLRDDLDTYYPPGSDTAYVGRDRWGLNWVVAGGESGPGARPMHPDWARTLRDQCEAADVPFLFKQWGAWAPTGTVGVGVHLDATATGYIRQPPRPDPNLCYAGAPYEERSGLRFSPEMRRVGKGKAGRELDGQTHDGYPKAESRLSA